MKLGFIGTGQIAKATITGILNSNLKISKIYVSKRNRKISSLLSKKSKKITVLEENQKIADKSDWVFLSITPTVGQKIIKELKFRSTQTIISFISTITLGELKSMIKVKAKIVRAIPLPPISLKKGPVPICPPNKQVKLFFNKIGTTIEIKDERSSISFWSTSGMMAPFYELMRVMTNWLVKRGVKRTNAQRYITSLFLALSEDAVINSKKDLKYLVKDSQTSKGLNEQGVRELTKLGFYKKLEKTLNSIHKRLDR